MTTSVVWEKGRRRSEDKAFIHERVNRALNQFGPRLDAMAWKEGDPGDRWYSELVWLDKTGVPGLHPTVLFGASTFRSLGALLARFGLETTLEEADIKIPIMGRWT